LGRLSAKGKIESKNDLPRKPEKPNNPRQNRKKEVKVTYRNFSRVENTGVGYHCFTNDISSQDRRVIYIEEGHPKVEVLKEKLQINKPFIIVYGKVDKEETIFLTFNKNNGELEIKEL